MTRTKADRTAWTRTVLTMRYGLVVATLLLLSGCATVVTPLPNGVDVLVLVGHQGADAWRIDGVQGGDLGDLSGDNPTLTLQVGQRYRFEIPVSNSVHPFELLRLGNAPNDPRNPLADEVLLSEEDQVTGSFEGDPDVDFVSDGDNFEFTLTQALADQLDGYRCGVHVASMWGVVVIASP